MNEHGETPKRLDPTAETLKSLYIKSGNKCAYPGCDRAMQIGDTKVGQVCHIEDAMPGERWNSKKSNEENRREENLILLCYDHHKITENIEDHTADELIWMKKRHERCVEKGIEPTTVTMSGDGDITMVGSNITGGAKVDIGGSGKKSIFDFNVDGGKNGHLSDDDFK